MKRLLTLLLLIATVSLTSAQTLDEVTKSYNEAVVDANEKPKATLDKLMVLLPQSEALGEEAAEITGNITGMLPNLQYNVARAAHQAKDVDGAISGFEKTIELANKYENVEMAKQVNEQLPLLYYSKGSTKLKAKDRKAATAAFNQALALDPNYSRAYYGLSKTFRGSSMDSVLHYTNKAVAMAGTNEKEAGSYKKGARIYLSKAAAKSAKGGNNNEAIDLYEKALSFTADSDATNLSKYNYKIAKAYQAAGKSADACAAYKKVTDAKYLKSAKYEMEQKLKCN